MSIKFWTLKLSWLHSKLVGEWIFLWASRNLNPLAYMASAFFSVWPGLLMCEVTVFCINAWHFQTCVACFFLRKRTVFSRSATPVEPSDMHAKSCPRTIWNELGPIWLEGCPLNWDSSIKNTRWRNYLPFASKQPQLIALPVWSAVHTKYVNP